METRIERTLAFEDRKHEWKIIGENGIGASWDPIVILGDPGMGKTELMRRLGRGPGMSCIHAVALVHAEDPEALICKPGGIADLYRVGYN